MQGDVPAFYVYMIGKNSSIFCKNRFISSGGGKRALGRCRPVGLSKTKEFSLYSNFVNFLSSEKPAAVIFFSLFKYRTCVPVILHVFSH